MESQSETTQTVSALKLTVLKTGEYDLWSMRMEQYLTFTDHALWEVIVNGDSVSPIASASAGVEGPIPPKTAEQKLARKNELKAKSTLMLAIPDEHLLKFHACKDAKSLWEAIKNRFGGNKESKKMQKIILKQNYENFVATSQEGLDKTYDRFQKLISQLEIHGEVISQEDANMKLLRSLPSAWNNIALIMINKYDVDTLSMDDLYNNLKVYESEIKGKSSSSSNSQNVSFVSSDNFISTNETVNTTYSVYAASSKDQAFTASYADDVMFYFFANQSNAPQLDYEDLEQIDADDLEEMDLKWTKVKCYNCYRRCHFARECRAPRNQGNRNRDALRRNAPAEEGITNFVLMAYTSQGSSSSDSEREALNKSNLEIICYQMGLESLEARIVVHEKNEVVYEEDTEFLNQISAKDKTGLGYDSQMNESEVVHIPPPYTENYMPSRPDLSFARLDASVYKTKVSETETSISKTSKDIVEKHKTVRPSAPIIEEWDTDSDNDSVFRPKSDKTKPKFTKINFVKSGENVKSVNKKNIHRQVEYPKKSQSPRDNRRNWNGMMTQKLGNGFEFIKKACFVCGSFNHLIKDCDFHDNKMVEKPVLNNKGRVTGQREIRPVWNNAQRVNHQNKLTHPHPKRNFVPTAVATKSGQVPVNAAKQSSPRAATSISTARPVNTATPKPKVNDALPTTYSYFKAHSPVRRAINQKSAAKTNNFNEKVNTARVNNVTTVGPKAVVSAAEGNGENAVKSSACWIWRPTGNVIDHNSKDSGSYMLKRFDYVDLQGRLKYALTTNPTIYVSLIEKFWQTATVKTVDNGEQEITATVDGKEFTVTEASVRRHLQLADVEGISVLPTTKIFDQLSLMGYVLTDDKLTFQKGKFSPQWRFLIHTILHCLSPKKTAWEQFSSNIATAIICLATNRTFNFSKLIFDGMVKNLDSKYKFLMYPRFIQIFLNKNKRFLNPHNRKYIAPTLTTKLFSNMKRGFSGEHTPLFQSMLVIQAAEGEGSGHPSEPQPPPSTAQPTNEEPIPTVVSSSHQKTQTPRQALKEVTELPQTSEPISNVPDEAVYEEWDDRVGRATTTSASLDATQASGSPRCQEAIGGSIAQTRSEKVPTQSYDSPLPRVNTLESDKGSMTLHELTVLCTQLSNKVESLETELKQTKQTYGVSFIKLIKKRRKIDETNQDPDITLVQHDAEIQGRHGQEMEFETKVYTAEDVSTAGAAVTTAGASISTASPLRVSTAEDISTAETLVYIRRSAAKDKAAVRLQEQLDEEERKRIARVHEEASSFNIEEWEDIQAIIEANEELAQRIQAEEREKYSEAEKARLLAELINQRKRYFAQQRAE
ncbi:ribonuclease H-like domain-containing protein [Tanacetum coccineum]